MAAAKSLAGTTAIVTGAASGMGQATSRLAAREGAAVVCIDVADPRLIVGEIEAAGGAARAVVGDVRDADMWQRAAALALDEFGRVDLLANVAGISPPPATDTVVDQTEDGWQRIIDINLKGAWLGMRAVLPAMLETGSGRIVNVASVAALRALPMVAAYSAAKAGLVGLTRQAAAEYARAGIRINAIAPGNIDTPMSAPNPPEVHDGLIRKTPAARAGTADEIAAAIIFLAGPGADFITGQVLSVDGGWSIRG